MKYNMTKDEYESLKEFIEINSLDIEIKLVSIDEALYNLGFSDTIPCVVEFDVTEEQRIKILDILSEYEIFAVMSAESRHSRRRNVYAPKWSREPQERRKSEEEIRYKKYGWIESIFITDYYKTE